MSIDDLILHHLIVGGEANHAPVFHLDRQGCAIYITYTWPLAPLHEPTDWPRRYLDEKIQPHADTPDYQPRSAQYGFDIPALSIPEIGFKGFPWNVLQL
jgi:hypothetical protein